MNSRIYGSGRACQRPRTSSGAKCFSCEGALAREIAFLKFLAYTSTFFQNPCCAARGHALAIWHRYAAPRSTALPPLGLRSAAKCAPRRATFISQGQYKINREIHLLRWGGAGLLDEVERSGTFFQASLFGSAGFKSALCLCKLIFFLSVIVALGGASFFSERSPSAARAVERGDKKPRGRGLGQRNFQSCF